MGSIDWRWLLRDLSGTPALCLRPSETLSQDDDAADESGGRAAVVRNEGAAPGGRPTCRLKPIWWRGGRRRITSRGHCGVRRPLRLPPEEETSGPYERLSEMEERASSSPGSAAPPWVSPAVRTPALLFAGGRQTTPEETPRAGLLVSPRSTITSFRRLSSLHPHPPSRPPTLSSSKV